MSAAMQEFMAWAVLFQEAVARRAGVNGTDLQCLNLLVMNGPMTPTELSEQTGLTAGGAITAVIDRLERAGLARRTRATTDRRKVLVNPDLDEAWRRLAPLYAGVQDRWAEYLGTLTDEQVDTGVRLLVAATEINKSQTAVLRGRADPEDLPAETKRRAKIERRGARAPQ